MSQAVAYEMREPITFQYTPTDQLSLCYVLSNIPALKDGILWNKTKGVSG